MINYTTVLWWIILCCGAFFICVSVNLYSCFAQLVMVLPWKYSVFIEYHIRAAWPPIQPIVSVEVWVEGEWPSVFTWMVVVSREVVSTVEEKLIVDSVQSLNNWGKWNWNFICTFVKHALCVFFSATYEFLNDVTSEGHGQLRSQHRRAAVGRYWGALQHLRHTDMLLVGLQSFAASPSHYTVPECIRNGHPVFYHTPGRYHHQPPVLSDATRWTNS